MLQFINSINAPEGRDRANMSVTVMLRGQWVLSKIAFFKQCNLIREMEIDEEDCLGNIINAIIMLQEEAVGAKWGTSKLSVRIMKRTFLIFCVRQKFRVLVSAKSSSTLRRVDWISCFVSEPQGHLLTLGKEELFKFVFLLHWDGLVQGFSKWLQRQGLSANQSVLMPGSWGCVWCTGWWLSPGWAKALGMCGSGGVSLHSMESVGDPGWGPTWEEELGTCAFAKS